MKNYLVKSIFNIKDSNWLFKDRKSETSMYENYLEMHRMSIASFKQFMGGEWELLSINGNVSSIQEAFKNTWKYIYDLWSSEKCNILYTDPDTLAINNFDIWNNFSNFMMFNFTDPKQLLNESVKIPYFFNAGVRYYPASMNTQVWDYANELVNSWDDSQYDTEQIILNKMLWCQGLKLEQALYPNIAYQAHMLPEIPVWQQDIWNGISINEAAIVHFHGSRNANEKLNLMRQIYETKRIGIS